MHLMRRCVFYVKNTCSISHYLFKGEINLFGDDLELAFLGGGFGWRFLFYLSKVSTSASPIWGLKEDHFLPPFYHHKKTLDLFQKRLDQI